jgi:hypothetical protein
VLRAAHAERARHASGAGGGDHRSGYHGAKAATRACHGARARSALLAGFLQRFVCPGLIEERRMRMFGFDGLRRV